MLRIWRSDRLEVLAGELAGLVRTPPAGADPFEPEVVVIQSGGMRRWLSLRLAGRLGIAANIRFAFPAAYVWELIRRADPGVPAESPFDPEVLAWRIWSLLDEPDPPESWAPLTRWLAGGSHPARRFDLATRIARVFDGYLVYRHTWPEKWQAGKSLDLGTDEAWQADLWRRIAKASGAPGGKHPRTQFLARFKAGKIRADNLPRRISLFALSDLAPLYAETFRALAERIDVNVFLVSPGREPMHRRLHRPAERRLGRTVQGRPRSLGRWRDRPVPPAGRASGDAAGAHPGGHPVGRHRRRRARRPRRPVAPGPPVPRPGARDGGAARPAARPVRPRPRPHPGRRGHPDPRPGHATPPMPRRSSRAPA